MPSSESSSVSRVQGFRRATLVNAAFFVSGGAALVYQVVWQRILALHTGIGVTSIAIIVAAFMAGLGLGSEVGGLLCARVSRRTALRLFAAIEVAVGIFASLSCRLYYEGPTDFPWLYRTTAGMAFGHLLALLLPTGLMGLSLPFLVRAMVRDTATASRRIAILYGVNTLGAAFGALVTPWLLIRFYGMEQAVLWGVGANLLAATAALVGGAERDEKEEGPAVQPPAVAAAAIAPAPTDQAAGRRPRLRLWMGLYALSGFSALALEVLWFRLLDVAVKSTAFTFGTMLAIYLLGIGAGSLLGARHSARFPRGLAAFLQIQCAIVGYAVLAVTLLARLPAATPVYRWFFEYWAQDQFFQLGADWNAAVLARLYLLLPLALYGLPTLLMGLSFAALQRGVQDDARTSGRKVGFLQTANIAGCVAGSLLVGLLLLDLVGTTGTLRLLLLLNGVALLSALAWSRGRWLPWALAFVVLFVSLPDQKLLWTKLHGRLDAERPSFVGEDATSVNAIVPGGPGRWRVSVNGLPHSWVPFEGIHTLLGAVPALIHPRPLDVAVIGLGSGETAWAVACRSEIRRLDVFEIAASQPRLLRALARENLQDQRLARFLVDPRLHITAADGRNALLRSDARYDIIQVDALYRTSGMSGTLYSVEFFRLCARHLAPGGLVCSQAPSRRAALTMAAAVPYGLDLGGNVMVGSNEPIPLDVAAWTTRLERLAGYFGSDVVPGIQARLETARPLVGNTRSRRGLNLDLFPRDEFQTPVASEAR